MDIEEAKEKIKFSTYSCLPFGSVMTDKEALETVLEELEKKDKIIELMATYINRTDEAIFCSKTNHYIIQQFEYEVEREGK